MLRCQGCSSNNYCRSNRRAESVFDCLLRCKRCGQLKAVNRLVAAIIIRPERAHTQQGGIAVDDPREIPNAAAHEGFNHPDVLPMIRQAAYDPATYPARPVTTAAQPVVRHEGRRAA